MKKIFFLLVSVIPMLLLTSCASVVSNQYTKNEAEVIWQQRQQQLSNINDWHMKGRMVVVNGVEFWSLSVDWQQRGDQYIIFLSGPFGAGKVQLAGSANGVLLKNSDEQVFYAETAEELLLEHTGVAMPLSYLRFWMLGLPHPKAIHNIEKLDGQGRLQSLSLAPQHGQAEKAQDQNNQDEKAQAQKVWNINFIRYVSTDKKTADSKITFDLPDKIFINQGDDIKVRVVVGEWLLDNT